MFADLTVREFLARTAEHGPAPGGGVVAATTLAFAAGLVAMGARFAGDDLRFVARETDALAARALELAEDDASAYGAVLEARRLPADAPGREQVVLTALGRAADVPLEVLAVACEVVRSGVRVARRSKPDLRGDVVTGLLLAEAAGRSAAELVRIDVALGAPPEDREARARGLVGVLAEGLEELPVGLPHE